MRVQIIITKLLGEKFDEELARKIVNICNYYIFGRKVVVGEQQNINRF